MSQQLLFGIRLRCHLPCSHLLCVRLNLQHVFLSVSFRSTQREHEHISAKVQRLQGELDVTDEVSVEKGLREVTVSSASSKKDRSGVAHSNRGQ